MFNMLEMGASGLVAQRARMDISANNLLNIDTTHNEKGEKVPFRRRLAIIQSGDGNGKAGVHIKAIKQDRAPFDMRYDPGHPDADPVTGMVAYPNVNMAAEVVNMMDASRAYEATISMMETAKAMFNSSLRLIA